MTAKLKVKAKGPATLRKLELQRFLKKKLSPTAARVLQKVTKAGSSGVLESSLPDAQVWELFSKMKVALVSMNGGPFRVYLKHHNPTNPKVANEQRDSQEAV